MNNRENEKNNNWPRFLGMTAFLCCLLMAITAPAPGETAGDDGGCVPNPGMALDYQVITNPDPLDAGGTGASIFVTAANPNPGTPVTINAVTLIIKPGGDAIDLTTQPGGVKTVAPGTDWTIDESHAADGVFIFQGPRGGVQVAGEGLPFTLSGITVNDQPGPTPLNIWEYTPSHAGGQSTCIPIGKFPAHFKVNYFYAEPSTIKYGDNTTIYWSCTDEDSATYTLDYEGKTIDLGKAVGSLEIDNLDYEGSVVFNLEVRYLGMVYRKQTVVTVQRPRIVDFEGPSCAVCSGQKVELSWVTEYTDHCQLYSGAKLIAGRAPAISDGYNVTPVKTTTYTLYACDTEGNHKDHQDFTINYGHWRPGNPPGKAIAVGQDPNGNAIAPQGRRVYTANWDGNTVSVIDTTQSPMKVTDTLTVGKFPGDIAVGPDGTRLYVATVNDHTVSVIDTTREPMMVVSKLTGVTWPNDITISPDGTRAYVTCLISKSVAAIDTTQDPMQVTDTVTVGDFPRGIAIAPDGTRVYVANTSDNTVSAIDTTRGAMKVTDTVTVGDFPADIAVGPGGTRLYVAIVNDRTVSVIDTTQSPMKVVETVTVGKISNAIAVGPKGTWVYVSNQDDNTVSVIDTTQSPMKVTDTVTVGKFPCGIAVDPKGARIYVSNQEDNTLSVIDFTCVGDARTLKRNKKENR